MREIRTLGEVINLLHPAPGRNLLRLVCDGPASTGEDYARKYGDRWEVEGSGLNPGKGPSLDIYMAANAIERVRYGLNLCSVPNVSEGAPQTIVGVRIPIQPSSPERIEPPVPGGLTNGVAHYDDLAAMRGAVGLAALRQKVENDTPSYDPRSAEGIIARLLALDPQPCVVTNEVDAIMAVWRLAAPMIASTGPGYKLSGEGVPVPVTINATRFGLLHHRLALRLGGDCNAAAKPFMLLADAPATKRYDIRSGRKPVPVAETYLIHENTITMEEMEQLAAPREVVHT